MVSYWIFEIKLAGKEVSVEVEVIDAPLDYNFLLGRSWTYAMSAIASTIFLVVVFPHEMKLLLTNSILPRKDAWNLMSPLYHWLIRSNLL